MQNPKIKFIDIKYVVTMWTEFVGSLRQDSVIFVRDRKLLVHKIRDRLIV
jgi:hypothetical protein